MDVEYEREESTISEQVKGKDGKAHVHWEGEGLKKQITSVLDMTRLRHS